MFDIITFGSASQDVFLKVKNLKAKEEKRIFDGKDICFSLGAKIPVKKIEFSTGGGGTNVAVTFANQGFRVAYCGMVGRDSAGRAIERELKARGISTQFLFSTSKKPTNFSIILPTKRERTILVYRGASEELQAKDIPWEKMRARWFYLAPLSGKLAQAWEKILFFARENGIRVAMNPGNTQLSFPKRKLKKLLNLADVLILNQEEASLATGIPYFKEKEIFKTLDDWVEGICIMTKGPLGGVVSDGKFLYHFNVLKVKKIVDRTGCGDAFGSGFLVGPIRCPGSIEYAIQLASANATGCLQKIGAKNDLLKKGESIFKFGKVKIKKTPLA